METSFSQVSRALRSVSKQLKSQAQEFLSNDTPLERQLKEATSNENWGCPSTILYDIVRASYSYNNHEIILRHIWEVLSSKAKYWRRIYKGLNLLEYLILHGPDRSVDEIRDNLFRVKTLTGFRYIEDQRERGSGVVDKAKYIVELVVDSKLLNKERGTARANRERFIGIGCGNRYQGSSVFPGYDRYGCTSSSGSHFAESRATLPPGLTGGVSRVAATSGISPSTNSNLRETTVGQPSYGNHKQECSRRGDQSMSHGSVPMGCSMAFEGSPKHFDRFPKQNFGQKQHSPGAVSRPSVEPSVSRSRPHSVTDFLSGGESSITTAGEQGSWTLPPPPRPVNSLPLGCRQAAPLSDIVVLESPSSKSGLTNSGPALLAGLDTDEKTQEFNQIFANVKALDRDMGSAANLNSRPLDFDQSTSEASRQLQDLLGNCDVVGSQDVSQRRVSADHSLIPSGTQFSLNSTVASTNPPTTSTTGYGSATALPVSVTGKSSFYFDYSDLTGLGSTVGRTNTSAPVAEVVPTQSAVTASSISAPAPVSPWAPSPAPVGGVSTPPSPFGDLMHEQLGSRSSCWQFSSAATPTARGENCYSNSSSTAAPLASDSIKFAAW